MKKILAEEIVYQIFPDRFNIGNNRSISDKFNEGLYSTAAIAKNWHEPVEHVRDSHHHMYGGDISGITEKLDYIKNLGATIIYMTPLFQSDTNHKYDSYDYRSIDKAFGGMDDFRVLINKAHEKGLKIVIDLVLNHISDKHPFFVDAVSNPESIYRDYFFFRNYPHEYTCWWGHRSMPELNLENPAVQNEFITGEHSILSYWANEGIDGVRLDCANDLGCFVNRLIRDTMRKKYPDMFVIGEVFNFAPEFAACLDSLQSYYFTSSIISLLNSHINSVQFGKNITEAVNSFSHEDLISNMNILSSHDVSRIKNVLEHDNNKLRIAVCLQFLLPGVPWIYYGDEIGMSGGSDPLNRAPMIWDESRHDRCLHEFYNSLIKLRKERRELRSGKIKDLSEWAANGIVSFLRYSQDAPEEFSLTVVNPEKETKKFRLFVPYSYLFGDMRLRDVFTGREIVSCMSYVEIEAEAFSTSVYVPDRNCKMNYDFFKRTEPLLEK